MNSRIYLYIILIAVTSGGFFSSCQNKTELTFAADIAPIIFKNCTPCHRKGEAGTFSFETYSEIVAKAQNIKAVTSQGFMPPWPADPSYSTFIGQKNLSVADIDKIVQWVDEGCVMGDSTMIPALPPITKPFRGIKPDLTLTYPHSLFLKGNNEDNFFLLKLPYEIEQDTFIGAIEFIPGNKKYLHHMNGHLVSYTNEKRKNVFDHKFLFKENGTESHIMHKELGLLQDDGSYPLLTPSVVNYLPGMEPLIYPEVVGGYTLRKKGAIYINSIHFGPSPVDQYDSSVFNIYYRPKPPERPIKEFILGTLGVSPIIPPLIIPPGKETKHVTSIKTKTDISLVTICPHMHLLGKSFLAYAVQPSGDTLPLIRINKWDFRWQFAYTFPKLLKIPAGSTIIAEGVYDNTVQNPNNPFYPPRTVSERNGSMLTTDEMFQFIVTYVDYRTNDENISLRNHEFINGQ